MNPLRIVLESDVRTLTRAIRQEWSRLDDVTLTPGQQRVIRDRIRDLARQRLAAQMKLRKVLP